MKTIVLSTCLLIATAGLAQADWRSERTTTGPNGVNSQVTTSSIRDGNTRTTQTEVQRDNGTGYTREVVRTWDPATKSWTRSVIGETGNGAAWTNNGGGSCNNGTCRSQSTYNGPQGRKIESNATTRFDRNGGQRRRTWFSNRGRSGESTRVWRRLR